jgi:plasmid stabilization system protein ParE
METFRIIIQPRASRDLDSIHAYIAKDSEQNAAGMVLKLLEAIDHLSISPGHTVARGQGSRLRHPAHYVTVWPYVVYYRVHHEDRVVSVTHIRHGARRRPRRFD